VRILSAFTTQRRSAAFRYYTWTATARMIGQRPLLGFGPGSYEYVQPQFAIAGFTRTAHQTLLQIAAETGIPSLALLLVALSAIVIELSSRISRAPPGQRLLAAAALAVAMAAEPPVKALQIDAWWPQVGRVILIVVLVAGCWLLVRGLRSQALAAQGEELVRQEVPSAAVARIKRAIALDPLDANYYEALSTLLVAGTRLVNSGSLQAAVSAQRRAIALAPTKPNLHRKLAYLYAQVGDLPAAIAAAQEAVQLYPKYTKGWLTLAELQTASGEPAAALASYRRVTELYFSPVREYAAIGELSEPGYAEAWQVVGRDALKREEREYANFALGMAAKVFMVYFQQMPLRREIMKLQGQWDEAQYQQMRTAANEVAQQLINLQRPMGLLRAGELYVALESPPAARRVLEQLCALTGGDTALGQLIVGRGCIDLATIVESPRAQKLRDRGQKLISAGLAALKDELGSQDWEEDDTYITRYMLQHGQPPPPSAKISLVTGGKQ